MKVIHGIKLKPGSREEELPGYSAEFPHIASFVELDKYAGKQAPWHWHKDVELFYMAQGEVTYYTCLLYTSWEKTEMVLKYGTPVSLAADNRLL